MSCKKCILWARNIKSMFFLNYFYISFQDMKSFSVFPELVINHYHINGLHLFWDSFEWFSLQINCDAKYFFLLSKAFGLRIIIVVTAYYFQIWNKKEHNIISCRLISSHTDPMYIETPWYIDWFLLRHVKSFRFILCLEIKELRR